MTKAILKFKKALSCAYINQNLVKKNHRDLEVRNKNAIAVADLNLRKGRLQIQHYFHYILVYDIAWKRL